MLLRDYLVRPWGVMSARMVYFVLRWVDLCLQYIVPTVERRICYNSIPDFTDNAFYVFVRAVRTRNNIEHVWLVNDLITAEQIKSEFYRLTLMNDSRGNKILILHRHSLRAYWAFVRSKHVVHTHGIYNFSRHAIRRIRVGLWHGMPIKAIGYFYYHNQNYFPEYATHWIATSYIFKYVIAHAFGVPPEQVLVIGQPRNDALIHEGSSSRDEAFVRNALHVQEGRRIVLWLPTFRTDRNLAGAGDRRRMRSFLDEVDRGSLDQLVEQAASNNCVVIIKLHPQEQCEIYESPHEGDNLRMYTDAEWRQLDLQLYDVLAVSDALITDVSSVMIDYAITGKPIGCIGFDRASYTRDLILPIEYVANALSVWALNNQENIRDFFLQTGNSNRVATHKYSQIFVERPLKCAADSVLDLLGY